MSNNEALGRSVRSILISGIEKKVIACLGFGTVSEIFFNHKLMCVKIIVQFAERVTFEQWKQNRIHWKCVEFWMCGVPTCC